MSKIQLLFNVVENMRTLADSIQAVANAMQRNEPATESEQPEEKPGPATVEKKIALEDVRSVLGSLSREGYTEQVRMLIRKYGGERLGEIDPAHYGELLKEAEELRYAPC